MRKYLTQKHTNYYHCKLCEHQVKIPHLEHCDLCDYKAPRKNHLGKHGNNQHKEVPSGQVDGLNSKHPYGLVNDTLHAKKHFGLDAFGPTLQEEDGKKSDVGFSGGFGDVTTLNVPELEHASLKTPKFPRQLLLRFRWRMQVFK